MSRRENIEALIQYHEHRLQILKERQAIQGISTDPAVLIEIEKIEAELEKLRAQNQVSVVASSPAQQNQYVELRSWLDNLEDTEFRDMIRSLLSPQEQTRLTSPVQSINRGDFLGTMQRWGWLSRVEQYLCETYPGRFRS